MRYIKIFILILSVLFSMQFMLWRPFDDLYYFINRTQFYDQEILCPFTHWLGYIWVSIFGTEAVLYRLLGWLCNIGSILLPYCLLQNREERRKNLLFLAAGIFIMGYWTYQIYTPDSPAALCFSALLVCCIKTHVFTIRRILLISFFSALAVLSRIPNVLVVPLVMLFFYLRQAKNLQVTKKLLPSTWHLILFVIIYSAIFYVIHGGFRFSEISGGVSNAANTDEAHTISGLIRTNINIVWITWRQLAFCASYVLLLWFIGLKESWHWFWKIILPLFTFVAFFIIAYWDYGFNMIGPYCCMASLVLAFLTIYNAKCEQTKDAYIESFFVCLAALFFSAGSDCSILKMLPVMAAFSPLILSKWFKNNPGVVSASYICAFVICAIYSTSYRAIENTKPVGYEKSCMQWTTPADKELRDHLMQDWTQYGVKDHSIFFGMPSHKMYQMTGSRILYNYGYWQTYRDHADVPSILKLMKQDRSLVLFVTDKSCNEFFMPELQSLGYKMEETNNCFIYSQS